MAMQLESSKYPHHFFYLMIIYFVVLLWSLSLSYTAYSFLEAQLLLLAMLLPAILLAVYAFRASSHLNAYRIMISILSVIAMILSVLMGYIFFG